MILNCREARYQQTHGAFGGADDEYVEKRGSVEDLEK